MKRQYLLPVPQVASVVNVRVPLDLEHARQRVLIAFSAT